MVKEFESTDSEDEGVVTPMEEESESEDMEEEPNTEDRRFIASDMEGPSDGDYVPTDESFEEIDGDDFAGESKDVMVERDQKVAEGERDEGPGKDSEKEATVAVRRQLTPEFEELNEGEVDAPVPPDNPCSHTGPYTTHIHVNVTVQYT